MNMTGNTILITGAGSGIGLALAEEFARMDNQVIVAARSPEKLKAAEQRGLVTIPADVSDPASIQALAIRVIQEFPTTNVVVHNAAISKREDLVQGGDSKLQEETVATNLLGPMRLTNALMPHLLKHTRLRVIEIAPPYVQTELGGKSQATDPNAMPLGDFISEVMQILKSDPHVEEVLVKRVLPHRYAAEHGRENYDAFFEKYHSRVM